MKITTVFKNNEEAPITGLNPEVYITNITDINSPIPVVIQGVMIDVGNGFYAFNFNLFEEKKDYTVMIDAGQNIPGRYQYGTIDKFTLQTEIEEDLGIREMVKVMFAVLTGTSSGGGTNNITFKSNDGTKNRIQANVDDKGNRLSVVINSD